MNEKAHLQNLGAISQCGNSVKDCASMISCSTLTKCASIHFLSLRNQEIGSLLKATTSFYANLMHLAALS